MLFLRCEDSTKLNGAGAWKLYIPKTSQKFRNLVDGGPGPSGYAELHGDSSRCGGAGSGRSFLTLYRREMSGGSSGSKVVIIIIAVTNQRAGCNSGRDGHARELYKEQFKLFFSFKEKQSTVLSNE